MTHMAHTKVGPGGRIVVPAAFRQALGLKMGERVVMELCDGEMHLYTMLEAARRAQESFGASFAKDGRSLVDELIAERRAEALRE